MLKFLLRSSAARLLVALASLSPLSATLGAQVALPAGTTTETFDSIGSGLPSGWSIYTGANATALGNPATLTTTATSWGSSTGQWANYAAANGFTGSEAVATQTAATNRALGIRQTGSFGDPGASANFNFSTLGLQVTSISFSAQMLSVQARSTVWSLQYATDAAPTSWTTIATFTDPGAFGSTLVTASGFGTALDNQSSAWLRIVALSASTGSGSRDTFGLDDFTIVTAPLGGDVAPGIGVQPEDQTVTEGATVQFTVIATGTAPLAYHWRKGTSELTDGGIVSGATTDTLTLTGVTIGDAGNYNVVVSNGVGSATSNDAALTVNPALVAPGITTQPSPQNVFAGGTATFAVEASGTPAPSYQWQKDGANLSDGGSISGATTATLTLANVGETDLGDYRVVVSNGVNPDAVSNAAALSLNPDITAAGQIAYPGTVYTQNFNTLPSTGTFTLGGQGPLSFTDAPLSAAGLGGWSFAKYDGNANPALFKVDAGGSNSGSLYSYGTGAASDRALGSVSSSSTTSRFGVTLVNTTGQPITQFTLSYTGEQWRRGSAAANKLSFSYGVGASDINTGTFTAAPTLDFVAPVTTGTSIALDGNASANRAAVSATINGLSWAPGQTLVLRWTDVDDSGSDDGVAIDDLTFDTFVRPIVSSVTPVNGTPGVSKSSPVSVTFSEPVNVTGSWFTLTGSTSGAHTATVTGGPTTYTITPDVPFDEETVTFTILAAQVTGQAAGAFHPAANFTSTFNTIPVPQLAIHTVQGSGLASTYAGQPVTVQGIVVASFQGPGQIGGYYLEAADADQDADLATSEGIHVFDNANSVTVGDFVTVTATVTEFGSAPNSETELSPVFTFSKISSGNALPSAQEVNLPFASSNEAERFEGMRVTFPQTLTVTNNYDYGHYGELALSHGRLSTPTNVVAPGAPAQALEAANQLNQILLDDGQSLTYPDPTPYLNSANPAVATRRTGSTTAGVTGILDNRFGTYVVEPTATPVFIDANPRENSPASTGSLRVAIGNVENFMNGDGTGGGFPTSRGATTPEEYARQLPKVTAAILNLAPDIMGLTEVENDRISNGLPDSYGPTSAIAQLVASLNANAPAGTTYAYVNAAPVDITTDVIHVALIYRTEVVEEVGTAAMLNDPAFNNVARNPLAQTFRQKSTGAKLTVCINHWRAKGGAASGAGNTDSGDGQGTNNALRVQEADATTAWLATFPTGDNDPDILIIGDLNSYAKEDPITHVLNAGYTSLTERFEGEGGYSYQFAGEFGHLDHALATATLNAQVLSAATWHVNADEPVFYDYNLEDKSPAQQAINAGTPYRYADHDPVVLGMTLTAPPAITAAPVSQTGTVGGGSVSLSVTATGYPAPTYQWRKDGVALDGATSSSFTLATPHVSDSGSYDVVITNDYGSVTTDPVTLTIHPAQATITLSSLEQWYTGEQRNVSVTTSPALLDYTLEYDGSAQVPVYPGAYAVHATVTDPDYVASADDTLLVFTTALVRHAPSLSGGLDGSLQLTQPENTVVNGSAWISGDLLVPGKPAVNINAKAIYDQTIDANLDNVTASYSVTLAGGSVLRHVVRGVSAVPIPTVSAPPAPGPGATRSVTLSKFGQDIGDPATLRDLTLNGGVGLVAIPPGTYGTFIANKNSGFTLGSAGSGAPAVYNFQNLTINGGARVVTAGPVILNLANGTTFAGDAGSPEHPDWLELNVASGGVTVNASVTLSGIVTAPSGQVTINGKATLLGRTASDQLTINHAGLLETP